MHRLSLASAPLLALTLAAAVAGCTAPASDDDGQLEADADDTTETGECPVGSEGCACTEGGGCDAGLACSPETSSCELEPECPVGSDGCACTPGGTCDDGLACVDDGAGGTACGCEPGELGCACVDGACGGELDCSAATITCEIPELPEDGADGWSDPTCWATTEGGPAEYCTAQRGNVEVYVKTACEIATLVESGELVRTETWTTAYECATDMAVDPTGWDDVGCFTGLGCGGRIGQLWVFNLIPDCAVPLTSEYQPWGPDYCSVEPPAPDSDFEEWRCTGTSCWARRGNLWLFPSPECALTENFSPLPAWSDGVCG